MVLIHVVFLLPHGPLTSLFHSSTSLLMGALLSSLMMCPKSLNLRSLILILHSLCWHSSLRLFLLIPFGHLMSSMFLSSLLCKESILPSRSFVTAQVAVLYRKMLLMSALKMCIFSLMFTLPFEICSIGLAQQC